MQSMILMRNEIIQDGGTFIYPLSVITNLSTPIHYSEYYVYKITITKMDSHIINY